MQTALFLKLKISNRFSCIHSYLLYISLCHHSNKTDTHISTHTTYMPILVLIVLISCNIKLLTYGLIWKGDEHCDERADDLLRGGGGLLAPRHNLRAPPPRLLQHKGTPPEDVELFRCVVSLYVSLSLTYCLSGVLTHSLSNSLMLHRNSNQALFLSVCYPAVDTFVVLACYFWSTQVKVIQSIIINQITEIYDIKLPSLKR